MKKILISLMLLASVFAHAQTTITYSGNRDSRIFHRPGCRHYACKNCTAVFSSREAAIAAGYRACKVCKP